MKTLQTDGVTKTGDLKQATLYFNHRELARKQDHYMVLTGIRKRHQLTKRQQMKGNIAMYKFSYLAKQLANADSET